MNTYSPHETSNPYADIYCHITPKYSRLGIPMSNAIGMFLRQIVMQRGIPFEIKLPSKRPLSMGELTKEEFDAELPKGMDEIENGQVFSADDVESEMSSIII